MPLSLTKYGVGARGELALLSIKMNFWTLLEARLAVWAYFCPLRCQYASSEVRVRWHSSGNTPSPHVSAVRLLAFWNWQSDTHTHFMPWMASCPEVREEPGFDLLSLALFCYSWHNYFFQFSCEQLSSTLRMPSYAYLNNITLHLPMTFTTQCCFPKRLYNASYKHILFRHNWTISEAKLIASWLQFIL